MKEEEDKKKTTDWPTFHRVLPRKGSEYLFSISLICLMIVCGFSNVHCFLQSALGERSIRIDRSCI